MSQKQAKRIRRIETELNLLHGAYYKAIVKISQLQQATDNKPSWLQQLKRLFFKH